jgi:hypothetical protein
VTHWPSSQVSGRYRTQPTANYGEYEDEAPPHGHVSGPLSQPSPSPSRNPAEFFNRNIMVGAKEIFQSEGDMRLIILWDPQDDVPETTIGKQVRMKGELAFEKLLRVDGAFEGKLISKVRTCCR